MVVDPSCTWWGKPISWSVVIADPKLSQEIFDHITNDDDSQDVQFGQLWPLDHHEPQKVSASAVLRQRASQAPKCCLLPQDVGLVGLSLSFGSLRHAPNMTLSIHMVSTCVECSGLPSQRYGNAWCAGSCLCKLVVTHHMRRPRPVVQPPTSQRTELT